jgi:SH3-like domain-containing protein
MTNGVLFGRVCVAVSLLLPACVVASDAVYAADSWRIVEIRPEGRVHLRQQATSRSRILAYIPGTARGLKQLGCSGKWCKTEFRGKTGWVFKRYLAPDSAGKNKSTRQAQPTRNLADLDENDMAALSEAKTLHVFNPEGQAISVYAFPSETLPIAGRLHDGTDSVEGLGACVKGWCYIRSGPLIGWLPALILAPAHEGGNGDNETTASIAATLAPPDPHKEQALNNTINTATQAALDTEARTAPLFSDTGNKYYSLAGLAGRETLPIRAEPNERSSVVGQIEQEEKRIEGLKDCSGKWCLIRVHALRGWIERRHLADPEVAGSQVFKVTGLPLWSPLEVIDRPSRDADIVGEIPAYATGIVPIGGCDDNLCHVRYLGLAGWVEGKHLTPQQ